MRPCPLLALGLALAVAGCDGTRSDGTAPPRGDHGVGNPLGQWAWGDHRPQAGTIAEARRIDETRRQFEDGLYDQAQASLSALFAAGCSHPLAFHLQAQLHAQHGELDKAIPWCDQAIANSPWWVEPRILLAQCYIKLQRYAAAETVFADIDHLAPKSPWGPYGQGVVALMRGDRERAVRLIDEALERDPRHGSSLRVRIDLAEGLKQYELEAQLLARYLKGDPEAAWAHVRLAELALGGNHLEEARRAYLRAYELEPDRAIAQRLAELAQRRGDEAEARQWQGRAGVAAPAANPGP